MVSPNITRLTFKTEKCLFILCQDRPNILKLSLSSIIKDKTDKDIIILLDKATVEVVNVVELFVREHNHLNIQVIENPKTYGNMVAYIYEELINSDIQIAGIIESDYLFRPQYFEEVIDVFGQFPNTLSIAGYHHPDTLNRDLVFNSFSKLTIKFFGKDIINRKLMYSPFYSLIDNKKYLLQAISNHTGCHFINVEILKKIIDTNIEQFLKLITDNQAKCGLCDAKLSSTYQIWWQNWALMNNIDMTNNFPILDICDFSIGNHYGGGEDVWEG